MTDARIEELCLKIYQKHRKAIDLIIEHRPDIPLSLAEGLKKLILEEQNLALDHYSKWNISFTPKSWDEILPRYDSKWSTCGRIFCFWFESFPEKLNLVLYVGPGETEDREKLFKIAANTPLLKPTKKHLPDIWCSVLRKPFLKPQDYADSDFEALMQKVTEQWNSFVANELPRIEAAIVEGWKESG